MEQGNIIVGLGEGTIKVAPYGVAEGSAVDLGCTEGGVTLSVPREYFEKMCDQELGVLELIKTSEKCTMAVNLAETTLENLALAIDYPTGAVAGQTLNFGGNAEVQELTIYLNVLGVNGATRKYTFHKAVCTSASSHAYKKDDKTLIETEFQVLQDTSKTTNEQMASVVDTGGDITPPVVVPTSVAVGDGTQDVVVLTITEANAMNENTIVLGDTILVTDTNNVLAVDGSIVYDSGAKTITFTPDNNWDIANTYTIEVTKALSDVAGNTLESRFLSAVSVS